MITGSDWCSLTSLLMSPWRRVRHTPLLPSFSQLMQFLDLDAKDNAPRLRPVSSRAPTRPMVSSVSPPPVGHRLVSTAMDTDPTTWSSATPTVTRGGRTLPYDRTTGMDPRKRGVNWMGTWTPANARQWTQGDNLPKFWDYTEDDSCSWFAGQWEWDTAKGLHVQFACGFDGERPGQWVRLNILAGGQPGAKLWVDVIKFGKKNAVRYCTKEDTRVESLPPKGGAADNYGTGTDSHGNPPPPLAVTNMYEDAVRGVPLGTIIRTYPREFARAAHGITRICAAFEPARPRIPATVFILYGVPGSGKSNWALEHYPFAYRKTIPGKFWEGYNGETEVIFEDFNPTDTQRDEVKLPQLLTWLDEYATRVEFKGGSSQLKANTFIFTSNIPPTEWYKGHPQLPALVRRVTTVMHFRLTLAERVELGLSFEESVVCEELGMNGQLAPTRSERVEVDLL